MESIKVALEYILIGGAIIFSVDFFAAISKTPNPISNQERIFLILLWPMTVALFIRSMFKNRKQ